MLKTELTTLFISVYVDCLYSCLYLPVNCWIKLCVLDSFCCLICITWRTKVSALVCMWLRSGWCCSTIHRETSLSTRAWGRLCKICGKGQWKSSSRGHVVQRGRAGHQLSGFHYLKPKWSAFAGHRWSVSRGCREIYRESQQSTGTSPVCRRPHRWK